MGLTALVQLWSEWGLRVCVILSLLANLVMAFLSRTRRRSASGWWAVGKLVPASFLWLAYQVAEAAATSAIGNLSLCGLDASEEEKQLVAFWAPFLLLHLGGPDNLTAYAMEDNKLSLRKALEMVLQFLGVGYTIYNYIYRGGHSQALLAASVIMYVVGIVRYGERACALWRANLDNMKPDQDSSGPNDKSSWELTWIQSLYYDGEALLLAQEMFPVWRHAMVDSSVNPLLPSQEARKKMIRTLGWRSMCKVVEMELSLMYEVLYTKANLSYASYWVPCYYLIRLVSPFATAAAVSLFWLDQEQHRGGSRARGSFIGITYALLRVNFLLDITWLLRVLGSTWTYANLQCLDAASGGWYRLHSLVEDPLSWMFGGPIHHRRTWSGTIGRYNLLRECTTTRWCPEWLVALVPDRLKEIRYLSKLPGRVKELLFERVQAILSSAIERTRAVIGRDGEDYTMEDIRTCWGQTATTGKS